ELLPFLFADVEDDRSQYTIVVQNVAARLKEAEATETGAVKLEGVTVRTFRQLVDFVCERVQSEDDRYRWAGPAIGTGTINAVVRRLQAAVRQVQRLIRSDVMNPEKHEIRLESQLSVVYIHNLNDRSKRFVVGVPLRRALEEKERAG